MKADRIVTWVGLAAVSGLLLGACTSGDTSDEAASTTAADTATTAAPTGPAPGVTADSIKVGVTYPDAEALQAIGLDYDFGDFEATYDAVFDAINADGGINGRSIEPIYAPINPTLPSAADEACVKLTEDEDVFVVVGFFLADAVRCPVAQHATAVIGGEQTTDRVGRAQAPWITEVPDADLTESVLRALDDAGELDGKVAVWSDARDQAILDDHVTPVLEDLGVDPVATGVTDEPADDRPAVQSSIRTIAENFDTAGADTVILVGPSGAEWTDTMQTDDSYRPTLLFLDVTALSAFSSNAATTDTSILEGAVAGGAYGPDQPKFEEPAMQACVATLADGGVDVTPPEDEDDQAIGNHVSAFFACQDAAMLQTWLTAAGETLNYGSLANALDGLEIQLPGDPDARTYGAPPAGDGDPTAYLFRWDADAQAVVLDEG